MKIGDWVFFKTRNWPKGVRYTHIDPATGKGTDITGQGFYSYPHPAFEDPAWLHGDDERKRGKKERCPTQRR